MSTPFQRAAPLAERQEKKARKPRRESAALAAGGLASLLTGICCVVPLLLVSIGLGGAWLASLRAFEPYRWVFIGTALVALAFAWKPIFRPAAECKPGEICAIPRVRRGYQIGFWAVALLLLFMAVFPYFAPLFY